MFSKLSFVLFFLIKVYKNREKILKVWFLAVDGQLLITLKLLFFLNLLHLKTFYPALGQSPDAWELWQGLDSRGIASSEEKDNIMISVGPSGKRQRTLFITSHFPLKASRLSPFVASIFDTTPSWKLETKATVVKQYVSLLCAPGQ